MARRKRETIEFRFYEIPKSESALALYGEKWKRVYGIGEKYLHFHNLFEIGYCHYGHGILVLDENECVYDGNMLSAIPASYPHTTCSEKEDYWEYLFFDPAALIAEMYPENPAKQREILSELSGRADLLDGGQHPDIVATVLKILQEIREDRPRHQETTRYLLKVFLLELLRAQESEAAESAGGGIDSSSFAQITPALRYIDVNFASNLKVSDLAEQCSLSETHLRRLFNDYVSLAPMDYVNLVRIQKACDIMRRTDHSMDQVAAECGFSTTSTFNRNFRKYMDTSPYQWKRGKSNYEGRMFPARVSMSFPFTLGTQTSTSRLWKRQQRLIRQ